MATCLYRYNKDKSNDKATSYFNGQERIGYDMIRCYTEEEKNKALAEGFSSGIPSKPKRGRKPKVENESERQHSPDSDSTESA